MIKYLIFLFPLLSFSAKIEDYLKLPKFEEIKETKAEKKKSSKYFFPLPNSIAMKPYISTDLDISGSPTQTEREQYTTRGKEISFFTLWSFSRVFRPIRPWAWRLRFSPSGTYYNWKSEGEIKFIHLNYGAKLILDLPVGNATATLGLGPMWIKGNLFSAEEHKITIAPILKIAYVKFLSSHFFVKWQFSRHKLLEELFNTPTFNLNHFSTTGIYLGYNFGSIEEVF